MTHVAQHNEFAARAARARRAAFTLVELLVVIGVITVLMAIAAYMYNRLDPGDKVTRTNLENLRAILAELEAVEGPTGLPADDAAMIAKFSTLPAYQSMLARLGRSVKNGRVVDGWGGPIKYFANGQLKQVRLGVTAANAASTTQDINSPDGRPFFASAGPDGNFTGNNAAAASPVETLSGGGDDNVYSFQL